MLLHSNYKIATALSNSMKY